MSEIKPVLDDKMKITYEQLCEFAIIAKSRGTLDAFADIAIQYAGKAVKAVQQMQRENAELKKSAVLDSKAIQAYWRTAEKSETTINALLSELAAAKQQLADAEKDATRYRWLRDPNTDVALVLDKCTGYQEYDEGTQTGGYSTYEYRAGAELDAVIDAARTAQDATEGGK